MKSHTKLEFRFVTIQINTALKRIEWYGVQQIRFVTIQINTALKLY